MKRGRRRQRTRNGLFPMPDAKAGDNYLLGVESRIISYSDTIPNCSARSSCPVSCEQRPRRTYMSSAAKLIVIAAATCCLSGIISLAAAEEEAGEFGRPKSKTKKSEDASILVEADSSTGEYSSTEAQADIAVPSAAIEPNASPGATPVLPPQNNDAVDNAVDQQQKKDAEFVSWCRHVMGIKMPHVEIRTFDYPDYLQERHAWDAHHDKLADRGATQAVIGDAADPRIFASSALSTPKTDTIPTVKVRGLAATASISPGETIISIPLNAMISVRTTIDHDPVLSTVLGPAQRSAYGWDGNNAPYYEVPLLVVAVLYHVHLLGNESPLSRYVDMMRQSSVDTIPFMLDHAELGKRGLSDGVKKIAADIREDVRDMYATVVGALVKDFPDVFGPPKTETGDNLDDWAYSYEKFRWAFAIVNSRHWNVPVQDLDEGGSEAVMRPVVPQTISSMQSAPAISPVGSQQQDVSSDQTPAEGVDDEGAAQHLSSVGQDGIETIPASQPTDSFVEQQVAGSSGENSREDNERSEASEDVIKGTASAADEVMPTDASRSHSFLAPLADLLNFGPPCTRGSYDIATHTFNVVATCHFQPGQEITFYYSDECEDIIYSNYGFTHPMIPPCPTVADLRKQVDAWKIRSEELDAALITAYDDMDAMEADISDLANRLEACGCQEDDDMVPRQAAVTQPPAAGSSGDDGAPQLLQRRSVTGSASHKELRGSVHTAPAPGGASEGGVSTQGHGGVRRLWRREERDIRDYEDSL